MRYALLAFAVVPMTLQFAEQTQCFKDPYTQIAAVKVVIKKAAPQIDPKDESCLATMIYGEARGEPVDGMVAVAYSAVNRANKKTICQVVLAPKQYSIFNNNPALRAAALSPDLEPKQKNSIDEESWDRSVEVARLVLMQKVKDPTGGATHYIADKVMKEKGYTYPRWAKQYIQVAEIGGHRFFKPYYPKRKKT